MIIFFFFMMLNKRQNRHWMSANTKRHSVLKPSLSVQKWMFYSIFFIVKAQLLYKSFRRASTSVVNSTNYYRCKILPQMINHMKKTRAAHLRTGRVYLLHDNTSSHKTKEVRDYLTEHKVNILLHPSYSPDLAPCDFWLFPLLTESMEGMKFPWCQVLAK